MPIALTLSPILAIRRVLAGLARDAGCQTLELSLDQQVIEVLARQPAAVLLIHHTDLDVALHLIQLGRERGIPILVLADRPADLPPIRQAGATPLSMRANWQETARTIRTRMATAQAA